MKALDVAPLKLKDIETTDLPAMLRRVAGDSNVDGQEPQPFFVFECLDEGEESLHKILLMIREWNTLEEFVKYYNAGGEEGAGDPDVEGEEGVKCVELQDENKETIGFGDERPDCNDLADMDDIIGFGNRVEELFGSLQDLADQLGIPTDNVGNSDEGFFPGRTYLNSGGGTGFSESTSSDSETTTPGSS